nr:uncharacterized protein LOC109411344 [Aedes albopictus]
MLHRSYIPRWCFYLHHYTSVSLGLYPYRFDSTRSRFSKNTPMLVATVLSKVLFITTKAFCATSFVRHVSSIPGSFLPLILYFTIDKLVLLHEIFLIITQLFDSKRYLWLLNENFALEEHLKAQFPDVPSQPLWVYTKVVPLKVLFIVTCCAFVSSQLDDPHAVANLGLFMSAAVYNDQFLIWMENIERSVDILREHSVLVGEKLRHVVSCYDELEYCEDFRRIAVAHGRIYRIFRRAVQFYSVQMMITLLFVGLALLLLMFLEFGIIYFYVYENAPVLDMNYKAIILMTLVWLNLSIMIKRCTAVTEKVTYDVLIG